ncbi:Phospholipase_D-nuclease N-terminal [Nocardioides exalbidus]|uniref:Phospholipase_D-nuclease N-terminal n=1 Tax=Nocardioides exalbidus TaxID=402596 RepID=A0A1H4K2G0_9ACTN|nr:PLD nuclease N-terminal domain-containing protein [Nocardioides exalbidus]SEB52720.1 Phospholipase_D-nuclease N-terminal [Nocardioides exalbidus]
MLRLLFFLVPIVLSIYCVVEAISSRDDEVRNLSKILWIVLILFFPFVGSIAWLAAGRPVRAPRRSGPYERSASAFPEYDRPGRFAAADPEADDAFLKKVRERAEEQRRRAQEQKRTQQEAGEAGPEPDQPTS